MRPTPDGALVFEGDLEARVAGQVLTDAGRADLLDVVEPPIPHPAIGAQEYLAQLREAQKGHENPTEYTVPASHREEIVATLALSAKVTSPDRIALTRVGFMGQRLLEYLAMLDAVEHPPAGVKRLSVVGMQVVPPSAN